MSEQPPQIDMSVLERLIEIRKQQDLLQEYRARAEQMKEQVDRAVYRRVLDDYAQRHAALEAQGAPLKAQARKEYEKLRSHYEVVNTAYEAARLTKEELEFRHSVGEVPDEELAEQLREPESRLAECRGDLAALEAHKQRFLDALPGDELEAPAPPVTPFERAPGAQPVEEPIAAPEATVLVTSSEIAEVEATLLVEEASQMTPAAPGPPAPEEERTVLLPEGVLVVEGGSTPADYTLGLVNYIGRSEENQIRFVRPGVSRRHALVSAAADGFTIRDLQSQNGTLVNGERITECRLADGDRISIGDVTLIFRQPKAVAAARSPVAAAASTAAAKAAESKHGDHGKRPGRDRAS